MTTRTTKKQFRRSMGRLAHAFLTSDAVRVANTRGAEFWFEFGGLKNVSVKDYEEPHQGDSKLEGVILLSGTLHVKPSGATWSAQFPVKKQGLEVAEDPGGGLVFSARGSNDPVVRLLEMALFDYKVEDEIRKHLRNVPYVPYGQPEIKDEKWAWQKLKDGLRSKKLPTEAGSPRKAEAREFMLAAPKAHPVRGMRGGPFWQFKHGDTRNYVLIDAETGGLVVPQTRQPFFRGTFDKFAKQANMKLASAVAVGDIFVSTWGYDQTNVDFYQVVGMTKTMVKLREIAKRLVRGRGEPTEYVLPIANKFQGPMIRKKLKSGWRGQPWVDLTSYSGAGKWDGKEVGQTGSMYGH